MWRRVKLVPFNATIPAEEQDRQLAEKLKREAAGILRWIHRHRARAVSRSELLERVWGSSGNLQTRTVDMTIANLRQKIERDPTEPRIVLTVTGAGYAWGEPEVQ